MSGIEFVGLALSAIAGIGSAINAYKSYKLKKKEKEKSEKINKNIQVMCRHLGIPIVDDEKEMKTQEAPIPIYPEVEREIEIETPSEFELRNVKYNRKTNEIIIDDDKYNKYSSNKLPY